jgi:hypothetical protein
MNRLAAFLPPIPSTYSILSAMRLIQHHWGDGGMYEFNKILVLVLSTGGITVGLKSNV